MWMMMCAFSVCSGLVAVVGVEPLPLGRPPRDGGDDDVVMLWLERFFIPRELFLRTKI
jgi:hypothetical protein